jgi:hypothetical protein
VGRTFGKDTERSWRWAPRGERALSDLGSRARLAKEGKGGGEGSCNGRSNYCGGSSAQGSRGKKQARGLRSRESCGFRGGGGGRHTRQAPRLPARERERVAFPVPAAPRELSRLPTARSEREGEAFITARRGGQSDRARDRAKQGSGRQEAPFRRRLAPPPRRPASASASAGRPRASMARYQSSSAPSFFPAPPSLFSPRLHHR